LSNSFIVKNASCVYTVDSSDSIVREATIVVRDGIIEAINPVNLPSDIVDVYDGRDRLIAPGLINTHSHLAMALLRGWAESVNLDGFLELVWAAEGAIMDKQTSALGTELGAAEALKGGTTTVLDMYLNPDATHAAAVKTGLRHVAGPIFFDFPGLDGMQWEERIAFGRRWPSILKEIGGPEVPTYFMPHSTYTDSPEHLREVADLAQELDARIHLHVSETENENDTVNERYAKSPTQVCEDSGILDRPTVFGHGVHLSPIDIEIARSHNTAVAHCPSSNLKLGSGVADLLNYQSAGLTVGLGTDGCSSSNDLDMWVVMRVGAHMVSLKHSPADVHPAQIIRAATIDGARAIGIDHLVGSIEVGKRADLIAIDLTALHLNPIHNIAALLVFAAGRSDVADVWVDGKRVVKDRILTTIDEKELRHRVAERVKVLEPLKGVKSAI
jgi:5-methylthioadenosine/S-adenosylhomocysteine deaminase